MLQQPAPLLFLGVALRSFVLGDFCGSSPDSLGYFYLYLPDPNQGQSQFFIRSYLDEQPIAHYDSLTRKMEPLVPWMEEAETFLAPEWIFRADLNLSKWDHLAEELHTWQVVLGCEYREGGSQGGFFRYGYNGNNFISFDMETLTWMPAQPQAQKFKEKWEKDPKWSQGNKFFLEKTCIEGLQRYLSYKNKTKQRIEPPVGKVTHKAISDRLEVLICQAFGFYPKEIQATWRRDGKIWEHETLHRNVAPNSNGTYYVWLSIEINPKERKHFQCHLEHEGLEEPLVLGWKEETATMWWILGGIVLVFISGVGIFFLMCWWWQELTTCCDQAHPQRNLSPSKYNSEDGIQIPLVPKLPSEHKPSYGMQRSQSDPGVNGSPLCRREEKRHPKWKTLHGCFTKSL